MRSYHDFEVYRRSKVLYPEIVQLSRDFPRQGYHLRDQMCRAANAIHADIAEGFGRSTAEFKMFLSRALGSCNELKSHIEDAMNVGWLTQDDGVRLLAEYSIVSKQLYRLKERWK